MKKRIKIHALLERIWRKGSLNDKVIITGGETGWVIYDGCLGNVPFLCSCEYVKSYKYVPGRLEIVETCVRYE